MKNYSKKTNLGGLYVIVEEGQSFEAALNKFKKKIMNDGILEEFVEKMKYTKPSDVRRKKIMMAKRAQRRNQRLMDEKDKIDDKKVFYRKIKKEEKENGKDSK